jgi:hypothetical protein
MGARSDGFVAPEQIRTKLLTKRPSCRGSERCHTPGMAHPVPVARGSLVGVSRCVIALGALLSGCGGGAGDGSGAATSDPTESPSSADDGSADDGSTDDGSADDGSDVAVSGSGSACLESYATCGGVLAGDWVVEDTCTPDVLDPLGAETWSRERLGLAAECPSTVSGLASIWSGTLSFRDGMAVDERMRADTVDVELTRSCLRATFGTSVGDGDLGATCSALSDASMECTALGEACQCTGHRDIPASDTGVYGVLGTSVAVATEGGVTRFEYCVRGDVLHWMESGQRIVLRRVPGSGDTGSTDPVRLPR